MRVTWEVEDGYAGKNRPQFTDIPNEDLEDLDEDERKQLIDDYVRQDFESNIYWYIVRTDEDR